MLLGGGGDTFVVSVQEKKMSPFSLIPGPPGAQLCGAAGGDVLAPEPLHGQLQHLCRLQWASPAVSFWKVFQRGV